MIWVELQTWRMGDPGGHVSIIKPMQRITSQFLLRLSKIPLLVPGSLWHEFLQHSGNTVETGILECWTCCTCADSPNFLQTQCQSEFTEFSLDVFHSSSVLFVYRSYVGALIGSVYLSLSWCHSCFYQPEVRVCYSESLFTFLNSADRFQMRP